MTIKPDFTSGFMVSGIQGTTKNVLSSAHLFYSQLSQTMIDKDNLINQITGKASQLFNGEKSQTREDVERNIKTLVGSALSKLELVTRDEFDTQVAVLKHTRERLEALEKEVERLKSENDQSEH